MKTLPILAFCVAMFLLPASSFAQEAAAEAADTASRIKKLTAAHKEKMNAFSEKMQGASREEQRALYQSEYPDSSGAAAAITGIVKANPEAEASLSGINWVLRNSRGKVDKEIYTILEKHYLDSEKMTDVMGSMMRQSSPEAKAFLKTASEKSEVKDVRGLAIYAMAIGIERDASKVDEYTALIEKLVAEHPDLEVRGRNVAARAKGKLFAAKNLAIGKEAPEIVGKDVDGKEMKLSDYRGKVVVIDFWGDW
ncbi:MAG: hypothetical protein ACI8XO_004442 [Verrucomicrobiales bacterium]|jgi:hypothetical protein